MTGQDNHPPAAHRWYLPMRPRSTTESHRVASALELLFDLCFVVAVARAGVGLEHHYVQGHAGAGAIAYLAVFFAIWWAWMNFTWFASAYDTDDVTYRVTTLVQIAGSLILAAGVGKAMTDGDFVIVTWGYVVMRLAMVAQWLRAAASDPIHRRTALAYAVGVTVVQLGWVLRLVLPDQILGPAFVVLVIAELSVPVLAERFGRTTYHPGHIADRYGAFTVIVLGEAVTAAALAVQTGVDEGTAGGPLVGLAAMGLLILFAMWWLYFDRPEEDRLTRLSNSLLWGYGHYLLFAATAAVGAGLSTVVAYDSHQEGAESALTAGISAAALTVPLALYLLTVAGLNLSRPGSRTLAGTQVVGALLVLAAGLTPAPVHWSAVVMVVLVAVMLALTRSAARRVPDPI